MTKWGDRPHWSFGGTYLGRDEHGDWIGYAAGTVFTRPGQQFAAPHDQVGRLTSLDTRASVAYFGDFGYELDITKLPEDQLATIK